LKIRNVLLLGRRPSDGWDAVVGRLESDDELIVLSLGYPVTPAQRAVLLRAQEIAAELGARFDALLIISTRDMAAVLQPNDAVHIAAHGAEERRLRRAFQASAR
jgi:hypothetical protein